MLGAITIHSGESPMMKGIRNIAEKMDWNGGMDYEIFVYN